MKTIQNLFKARWMSSLIFLILLFLITGMADPAFLSYSNIISCFNTATMYTLLAIGMYISSVTESQAVAAGLCFVVMLVNYFLSDLAGFASATAYSSLAALALTADTRTALRARRMTRIPIP